MITGSCLCGGVRFAIQRAVGPFELCHCRRCRKASGGAFVAGLGVRAADFELLEGKELIATYEAPLLESPPPYRVSFCRRCGSPVPNPQRGATWFEIPAGLLDDDPGLRPDQHIFVELKAPWFAITDTLPQYDKPALLALRLAAQLEPLERRYREWAAPIDRVIKEKTARLNRNGYGAGDWWRDVQSVRAAQQAKDDPYAEMYALLDLLCPRYLAAPAAERAAIRGAVGGRVGMLSALLGYIHRAARQIHSPADEHWLIHGLAAASIENCHRDFRDVLLALAELYVAAEAGGMDPKPAFARVAALSDSDKPAGGPTPVREMLAHFHDYAVLAERKARAGAR